MSDKELPQPEISTGKIAQININPQHVEQHIHLPTEPEAVSELESVKREPFSNVPFQSKGDDFIGRKGKIDEIQEALNKTGCAVIGQAVNIKGMGGLGKTQLAVEYAHFFRKENQKDVYFLIADEDIDAQLVQIAEKAGWINESEEIQNKNKRARKKFQRISDCLILLDNVEKFEDVEEYIPQNKETIKLLITSRNTHKQFYQINLEFLKRPESRELFLKVSNREITNNIEEQALEKLLDELSDLPLAIELVGGYLHEHRNISFSDYVGFLNEYPLSKLEEEFPEVSFTKHDASVIRTLKINSTLIKDKPLIGEILDILTWSGKTSMGFSLLSELVGEVDEFAVKTALGDAINLRLIKYDVAENRYSIHRLLARVRRLESPLEEHTEWHIKIVRRLEEWFSERVNQIANYSTVKIESEHLSQWQRSTYAILPGESAYLTALYGDVLALEGEIEKAKTWYERAFFLFEEHKIRDSYLLVLIHDCLGSANKELENTDKAIHHMSEALKLTEESNPIDLEELSHCHNNLGTAYCDAHVDREALYHKINALRIFKRLRGVNHITTATYYQRVAHGFTRLKKYEKAVTHYEKSFAILKKLDQLFQPQAATLFREFGELFWVLGKTAPAIEQFELSLKVLRKNLPDSHPRVIASVCHLISYLINLGKLKRAIELKNEFGTFVHSNHPTKKLFETVCKNLPKKKKRRKRKRGKKK